MRIVQSIILGIIQGASEFIPVSSSGHLVLVRDFFGWEDPGFAFDIALHCATLFAVVFYFRKTWLRLLSSFSQKNFFKNRLAWGLLLATIPAVLAGYFGEALIAEFLRSALTVGICFILMGFFFILIERGYKQSSTARSKEVLGWWDYLLIGIAQGFALVPGISRSGITIGAGMQRKMSRKEAAEFAFLLLVPVILGAVVYDFLIDYRRLSLAWEEILVGFLVAGGAGYLSIRFLMNYLVRHRLNVFAYYLFVLGAIAVIFSL